MIPAHERRILEAHVRRIPLSRLALQQNPLDEYQERELKELIKLRMRGLPLQYLTGSQGFYGREFYVNTAVLIPRPETEGLIEEVLKRLPAPPVQTAGTWSGVRRLRALEFGTGSGCISLTLGLERPDLQLFASDCSREALAVADENAQRFRTSNVEFFHVSEDLHLWQYDDVGEIDLLVSNPPYLLLGDEIGADVRDHEPAEALFSPDGDPLYYYKFLIELFEGHVVDGGFAAFELSEAHAAETAELFSARGWPVEIKKDLPGKDRYLFVRKVKASHG